MAAARKDEKRPTAFISYAQSSPEWQEQVLSFTTALRVAGGVDAEMDLFHRTDHQRWSTFGPNLIDKSDFTLIVVDAAYKRRWRGEEKTGVGAGVAREAAALRAIYERDQSEFLQRVKVVLLPGATLKEVPDDLLGDCEHYPVDSFGKAGLEDLLRSIWGKPKVPKPPLGDIPVLPPQAMAGIEGEDAPERVETAQSARPTSAEAASTADARDETALSDRLEWIEGALMDTAPLSQELLRERSALKVSLRALQRARPGRTRKGERPRKRIRPPELLSLLGRGLRRPLERFRRIRRSSTLRIPPISMRTAVVVLMLAAALATVAGVLASGSSGSGPPIMVKQRAFELRLPPAWKASHGKSDLLGLAAPDAVELEPPVGGEFRSAAAGISGAAGPTLLPAVYRRQVGDTPKRATVSLGSLQAYRYTDLRAPGASDPVTIYAAPSTLGVVTLACPIPASAGDAASGLCEEIASTLRLRHGRPFRLGPSRQLAKALDRRLTRLTKRRAELRKKLLGANDADEQAAAAAELSDAFRAAGKGLEPKRVTPESAPALVALLASVRVTRDAYASLAAAAREEDRGRYEVASGSVRSAEKSVNQRLQGLRALGYQLGAGIGAGGKQNAGGS